MTLIFPWEMFTDISLKAIQNTSPVANHEVVQDREKEGSHVTDRGHAIDTHDDARGLGRGPVKSRGLVKNRDVTAIAQGVTHGAVPSDLSVVDRIPGVLNAVPVNQVGVAGLGLALGRVQEVNRATAPQRTGGNRAVDQDRRRRAGDPDQNHHMARFQRC